MKELQRAASVEAVVVNYNAGDALVRCVESIETAGARRVVVVDNASSDDSLTLLAGKCPAAEVVRRSENGGYGTAANQGAHLCGGPYLLISNPDVVVGPSALDRLAAVLDEDPAIAVVGPLIVDPDGAPFPSARSFPSVSTGAAHAFFGLFDPGNRWSRRYRVEGASSGPRDADWVSGACLLVRKVAFDSIGGFDERYFMYVEDLDLCWRLGRAGWRVRFEPGAEVLHEQGLSTRRHPYRMIASHHRSTLRFARRSMTGKKAFLVPLVGAALGFRYVLAVAQKFWSSPKSGPGGPE